MELEYLHVKNINLRDVNKFSIRTIHVLESVGVFTIGDLVEKYDTKEKLDAINGLGAKCYIEIESYIPPFVPGYLGKNTISNPDEVEVVRRRFVEELKTRIEAQDNQLTLLNMRIQELEKTNEILLKDLESARKKAADN